MPHMSHPTLAVPAEERCERSLFYYQRTDNVELLYSESTGNVESLYYRSTGNAELLYYQSTGERSLQDRQAAVEPRERFCIEYMTSDRKLKAPREGSK